MRYAGIARRCRQ